MLHLRLSKAPFPNIYLEKPHTPGILPSESKVGRIFLPLSFLLRLLMLNVPLLGQKRYLCAMPLEITLLSFTFSSLTNCIGIFLRCCLLAEHPNLHNTELHSPFTLIFHTCKWKSQQKQYYTKCKWLVNTRRAVEAFANVYIKQIDFFLMCILFVCSSANYANRHLL